MLKQEYLSTQTETVDLKSPVDLCLKILNCSQGEITEETTLSEIERQLQENGIISDKLERSDEISKLLQLEDGNPETIIYVKRLKSNDTVVCQKGREILINGDKEYQQFQDECSRYINDSNSKVLTVKCLISSEDNFSVVLIEKCLF